MDINYYKQYEPIFGAWRITRLIGEGSFGKVFEMEREDFGVTYKAALKAITVPANESEVREVMAEGMDEASVRDYFGTFVQDLVKEFALMSKLKGNSNVVSYENHQVIEHKGGIGWDILIQMELLTPLNEYTRKHTITRQDVIRLGIDLCRALELCQKYNIIHRDVKPENIFISDAGDYKLGDFGIARTVEKTTSGLSKNGTYTYMAPEVYKGEAYGSTVDIYSLGIVLYRLLNGNRTPFLPAAPAPITHADRENALVKRLSGAALPPPSHAEGRLSEIVLKACAYDPKERYSSPMQMRHELEAILYSQEEGKYIYPEGDDVPQDSVHYVKTGEEGPGAGYERTQRDGDGTAGRFAGSGTASDFGGSRTTSDFGGSRSGGRFDGTRTVSDFGGRERTGGSVARDGSGASGDLGKKVQDAEGTDASGGPADGKKAVSRPAARWLEWGLLVLMAVVVLPNSMIVAYWIARGMLYNIPAIIRYLPGNAVLMGICIRICASKQRAVRIGGLLIALVFFVISLTNGLILSSMFTPLYLMAYISLMVLGSLAAEQEERGIRWNILLSLLPVFMAYYWSFHAPTQIIIGIMVYFVIYTGIWTAVLKAGKGRENQKTLLYGAAALSAALFLLQFLTILFWPPYFVCALVVTAGSAAVAFGLWAISKC